MNAARDRIVFVAMHIEPPNTGGEKYNLHLIRAAERAGFRVDRLAITDCAVCRWLERRRLIWRLRVVASVFWLLGRLWRLRHYTLMFDAWIAPLLWPAILCLRTPYFVMVHHLCADFGSRRHQRLWGRFCERALLRGAHRILTVSRSSRRQVERRMRAAVPVDIINTAFQPVKGVTSGGGDVVRILYVGHMMRVKGVHDLVRAVSRLPDSPDWHLDMVGGDTMEPATVEELRALIQKHDLGRRVTMHGRLNDRDLLAVYLSSDIFVLPSHWEGYGIVLLEAMSHGLAVIASDAGAIPEVVHDGDTGVLFPVGDIERLGAAIRRLMDDDDERGRLARNARVFARSHPDWEEMERQGREWWRNTMASLKF